MKPQKIYHDTDADLGLLKGKKIAVLGFGSQGSAQALNLKDSGLDVIVGLKKGSLSWKSAQEQDLKVFETAKAAGLADYIHVLVPDEVQGDVYKKGILPFLGKGKVLSFSHGFNICFGFIKPPKNVDVVLISPKAPGKAVREKFISGEGANGVFAVHQNSSGKAKEIALAFAKGIGLTRQGISQCTFEDETHINLFAEQAVLCGGLSELIKSGYETLVKKGYPEKLAYVEIVKQTKLLADLIAQGGIEYMWSEISNTAEYGGRTRGPRVIGKASRTEMKKILKEIEGGKFAKEWIADYKNGLRHLNRLREGK